MLYARSASDASSTLQDADAATSPARSPLTPLTARGEATRRRLLQSAQAEFAAKGFHIASVSSVTAHAGVGQGTFYLYFRTKEEVFATLVRETARQLADQIGAAEGGVEAALDVLIRFVADHPGLYRIAQEAPFVDPAAFRYFQQQVIEALEARLAGNAAADQAWTLFGLWHAAALRQQAQEGPVSGARQILETAGRLTTERMEPRAA